MPETSDRTPRVQQNAERSAERHGSARSTQHAKLFPFNPREIGDSLAFSIAPGLPEDMSRRSKGEGHGRYTSSSTTNAGQD